MTRLFLRLYVGLILTAVGSFFAVSALLLESTRAHDEAVVEDALHGGAALLASQLRALDDNSRTETLREFSRTFRHPLAILPWDTTSVPGPAKTRMSGPRGIAFFDTNGAPPSYVALPLAPRREILVLGPLPDFAEPSALPLLLSLGSIMLVSALLLLLAFKPLRRELLTLEHTAERLARGDFAARVEDVDHQSLPLARALNRMAEETERLVRGQRQLFHMVSHELRTPIARLRFALELVEAAPDEAARALQARGIEADVDALEALVDELVTYARLEHVEPSLQAVPIVVADVLRELVAQRRAPAITLTLTPAPQHLRLRGDLRLFRRAIDNLIDNALHHARRQVLITCEQHGSVMHIHVDDDGPGIEASDRERAFAPFVRLRSEGAGTGLGLPIVRRIAEWHQGRAYLDVSPSGGVRATTEWPADEA